VRSENIFLNVSKIEKWENAFNLFKEGSYNHIIPDDQG
jgi:hypothetical protein